IVSACSRDLYFLDLEGNERRLSPNRQLRNPVDRFNPPDHVAEDRVLTIQILNSIQHNKEGVNGTIRIIGASHRHGPSNVWLFVELGFSRCENFFVACGQGTLSRANHPSLDNKVRNDAVKSRSVIQTQFSQLKEAANMFRSLFRIESNFDFTKLRVDA